MLLLIALLLPALRSVPGSSIYAYAENRFGRSTRRALAGAFLVSRGLALGVVLYASALVVAETLGWPVDAALLLVGAFAPAYTGLGGIVADIWSDVIQLALGNTFSFWPMLLGGLFLYLTYYGCDQSQAQRLLTARYFC